ncbi:MAG: hypothetical protein Ct9H300mP1_35810 [Planctomycetaceae bacterium]|nr:MAG: hypothetical protein Ct9H300mP1_35810 [Planctomycetaceae bacterium]
MPPLKRQSSLPVRQLSLVFLTAIGLSCLRGTTPCRAPETPDAKPFSTTWAAGHPELLELFGRPFAPAGIEHRKARFRAWPSKEHRFPFAASQPTLVRGPKNQLFAHCWSVIARSVDGGSNWKSLGSPPADCRPPGIEAAEKQLRRLWHHTPRHSVGPLDGAIQRRATLRRVLRPQLPHRPLRHTFDR